MSMGLLTQMHGNEGVINRCADDETLDCGRRSAEYFEAAD